MAGTKGSEDQGGKPRPAPIPPGATKKASDRTLRPWEPPSHLGDRHAAGTPGGGSEVGGLAGTNVGDGAPENADLEEALGSGVNEYDAEESAPPYSGSAGGAVGGTPAEGRSSGGNIEGGIAPGGVHRGDSTLGARPESGAD